MNDKWWLLDYLDQGDFMRPEDEDARDPAAREQVLEVLLKHRVIYQSKVRDMVVAAGGKVEDKALSERGVLYMLECIHREVRKRRGRRPGEAVRVLDMGLGFSTYVIQRYAAQLAAAWRDAEAGIGKEGRTSLPPRLLWYVGVDHDRKWAFDFVAEQVIEPGLPFLHEICHRAEHDYAPADWHEEPFDVMMVDHGPQLQNRAADTPWLAKLLRADGIMLFDDWRPKHEGRIRRAIAGMNGKWEIGEASWARRYPTDKAIGWARRAQ